MKGYEFAVLGKSELPFLVHSDHEMHLETKQNFHSQRRQLVGQYLTRSYGVAES